MHAHAWHARHRYAKELTKEREGLRLAMIGLGDESGWTAAADDTELLTPRARATPGLGPPSSGETDVALTDDPDKALLAERAAPEYDSTLGMFGKGNARHLSMSSLMSSTALDELAALHEATERKKDGLLKSQEDRGVSHAT